jgi:hypothetical protein
MSNTERYYKVTEYNEWEGETWYHYFLDDGEGKVLSALEDACQDDLSEPELVELTEDQTDVLANLEPGYMDIHWFGVLTDFEGLSKAAAASDLYKGKIRNFGEEIYSREGD